MATTIRYDNGLYAKLLATSLILNCAKAKVELYNRKQCERVSEMIDDQNSYEALKMYYQDEGDGLLKCAEESIQTSFEAEIALTNYIKELNNGEAN
ncbi:hypothetical protein H1230_18755 [Paenibacillus sp. 19GGS1-52]|uniref:hypothetical protein n=1 Tax=Paenibacillus sp. 19GGS1-52 TaxID=2758563 RepID=UPI001EFAFBBE|nr:hypothetical protein [Paenibacillus sp. 19GGS1-52]ULO05151.1 hypothetical protein H1230_18755 [Paenibacillus sp. 19GGS1-52]